ncbi:hypothetical protein Tco_0164736 [Tanacetum coccineum]
MPKIEKYVTESLGAEVLVRSTNQPQTSYAVAASLGRDDQDKDEDPSTGSNRGSKRGRSGKEAESSKELKNKESKATNKLTNLNLEERYALNEALRMFTRRIVIQERVEDLQLGVKSYPKKINLKKPDTYRSDLRRMTAYTSYPDIQGIIYVDEMNKNRLMRTDELYKFSDGTLNHVRTALNDIDL